MQRNEVTEIEINLLLHAIKRRYNWDFTHYKKASLRRRVDACLQELELNNVSELIPVVLHDVSVFEQLLHHLSVPVTEMFRDAQFFHCLRTEVVPILKTYPYVKVWHPGCASGEEVYSLAILLQEENLYDRCRIYATDINDEALNKAKQGTYRLEDVQSYEEAYHKSGGRETLLDYFEVGSDKVQIKPELQQHVTFTNHNLTRDPNFTEFTIIICRNVFIYFDRTLQRKVARQFYDCLYPGGFLCLGLKESLQFTDTEEIFEPWQTELRIYRKRIR